jgi:hypothetical protein
VPKNAPTVTKTAVGIVELLPSTLLNVAFGPQIAVTNTATHIAVIASDAHISGTRRSDDHRSRSCTTGEGSCDMVDISNNLLSGPILAWGCLGVTRVAPDRDYQETACRVLFTSSRLQLENRRGKAPAPGMGRFDLGRSAA